MSLPITISQACLSVRFCEAQNRTGTESGLITIYNHSTLCYYCTSNLTPRCFQSLTIYNIGKNQRVQTQIGCKRSKIWLNKNCHRMQDMHPGPRGTAHSCQKVHLKFWFIDIILWQVKGDLISSVQSNMGSYPFPNCVRYHACPSLKEETNVMLKQVFFRSVSKSSQRTLHLLTTKEISKQMIIRKIYGRSPIYA